MELTCIPGADTTAKAKSEAEHVVRLLQGKNLTYPIYYDMEDDMLNQLSNTQIRKYCKNIFEYDWNPMDIKMSQFTVTNTYLKRN